MKYAADLHLHSRHSSGVSPQMTVETLARQARRKGIDILGTGDCLQPEWMRELQAKLVPIQTEPGWFAPAPHTDRTALHGLAPSLHRPLRFVLSTEVSCAPPGTPKLGGIHHLIYFPSFDCAKAFQNKMQRHGNLAEGRPELALSSRQLLEEVLAHDTACHLAPAHVLNPYFSSLGSQERHATLEELFGDLCQRLLAVETGLTSTPPMCRRLATLDRHALYSCSDAHSPENLGRECTLLDIESGYTPLFAALHDPSRGEVKGTLKFPIGHTRYHLNWCGKCAAPFDATKCPQCGGRLAMGSRDRLEQIAGRAEPAYPEHNPPFHMLLPLRMLLAEQMGLGAASKAVDTLYERLLNHLGHERFVLTEAGSDALASASTPQIARAILHQREHHASAPAARAVPNDPAPDAQMSLL